MEIHGSHLTHQNDGGRNGAGGCCGCFDILQCRAYRHWMGRIAAREYCRRRIRAFSRRQKPLDDPGQLPQPHEEYQRIVQLGYRVKILRQPVGGAGGMSGDDVHAPADAPMGHRDSRLCRNADGGRDPGNFGTGNARRLQRQHFLPASAEQVGVAALQAHHVQAGLRQRNELAVDLLLRSGVVTGSFPHVYPEGPLRCGGQQGRVDEVIIHDRLTLLQHPQAPDRDEVRFSASGTHQRHAAKRRLMVDAPGCLRLCQRRALLHTGVKQPVEGACPAGLVGNGGLQEGA